MSFMHREKNARHTRLFELIRQKNQAETTVARVAQFDLRPVSAEEAAALQAAAARSLQVSA